jgi:hypothetical protein
MTKKLAAVTSAVLLAVLAVVARRSYVLCDGFLPENTMSIPADGMHALSGLDEAQFNRVLDRVEQVYTPIIQAKGGKLFVNRLWKDGKVNAYATQNFGTWSINMYGGLARHPAMNEEGLALVACHELGHHIGGAPKLNGWMQWLGLGKWATNEGGADYFATLKCMRLVSPAPTGAVETAAADACDASFRESEGRSRCRSGALAGQAVAKVFQTLMNTPVPQFATPDRAVVAKMYDGHPMPQCRLDTYFQGALCGKPVSEDVALKDPNPGACTRRNGDLVGLRPRCWYKTPADEPAGPAVASAPVIKAVDVERFSARLQSMQAAFQDLQ